MGTSSSSINASCSSIAMFDYRILLNILRPGEWNMWGDGIIDSMIDPCGALQAPASSSKRPGNINCLLG